MEIKNELTIEISMIELNVKDIKRQAAFYKDMIGLEEIYKDKNSIILGDKSKRLIKLIEDNNLKSPISNQAGLYHIAFVFSSRSRLAKVIFDIAQYMPNLYEGSADHIVTEAFYFHDNEGNGVELYFDKPKSDWKYDTNGKPLMGSEPLDINKFVSENIKKDEAKGIIGLGHIHLKVGDIKKAKEFYTSTLLFDIVTELPYALFISHDNYHHHIGMNIWESRGAGARKDGYLGLERFEIRYFDSNLFEKIRSNLINKNIKFTVNDNEEILVNDPWLNKITLKKGS